MTTEPISVRQPLSNAWQRMKDLLFRPFSFKIWFVLGFTAWLAGLASRSGGGGGFGGGGQDGEGFGAESVGEAMSQMCNATASRLNSAEYCFRSVDPIEHLLA